MRRRRQLRRRLRIVRGSSGSDDDCDPSGYVAVSGRGCESYIHMDGGYYGGSTYLSGGSTSLEDCAAAVRAYDGQDGCRGAYFFYESDGYCNCPRDDCELGSDERRRAGPRLTPPVAVRVAATTTRITTITCVTFEVSAGVAGAKVVPIQSRPVSTQYRSTSVGKSVPQSMLI